MTVGSWTRLKIWLVLTVIFGFGCVTGTAISGLYSSLANTSRSATRERAARDRFEKLRRELNLTDQQTTAVRTILDDARNEYEVLRNEVHPRFERPRLNARVRIRSLLRPEQQLKFDALGGHEQDR